MSTVLVTRYEVPDNDVSVTSDSTGKWLAVMATIASLCAFAWYSSHGDVLAYKDAVSHMEIARRVIDSPTSGFAQLGGVWLPLPHVLMVPFIWFNPFYYSGFAGSIVSMASYVICSVLLYKTVYSLTQNRVAGVVGALVFLANPNVLYMQSTPMTELLLFVCIMATVYYMVRWVQTDKYWFLVTSGVACFFGTLSRYEAWVLFLAMIAVVALVLLHRSGFSDKLEGILLAFSLLSGLGLVMWFGWNLLFFGNPLYFQDGEYSKPSLWVGSNERAVNHFGTALQTYWYAMTDNLGVVIVGLMVVGYAVLLVQRRKDLLPVLPVLSLLVFVPFFVLALYKGQRPLHVMQVSGDLYNVRFGLLMVMPAAVAIGYLTHVGLSWVHSHPSKLRLAAYAAGSFGLAMVISWALIMSTPITLQEPHDFRDSSTGTETQASNYLRTHYHGGTVLASFFGNESLLFDARVSLKENIYEGSYKLWGRALQDPSSNQIDWIVMRKPDSSNSDTVYSFMNGTVKLDPYELVYSNATYQIYKRR